MKLIHIAFGLVAASLLPTASADEPASKGKPFTISFASSVTPVNAVAVRYPSYAGVSGQEGACDVSFVISPAGEPDAIRVGACTSEKFRRSAKEAVKSMTFAPKAQTDVHMKIRWAMDPAATSLKTASLN
jgi:TonB family protein